MTAAVRIAREGDEAALKQIWAEVFGDGEEYVNGYFAHMYEHGRAVCAEADGTVAAMAFAPVLGELVTPDGLEAPCGYLYAVATRPEFRSRGLAAAVSNAAAELCEEKGEFTATCPAEASLFDYYAKNAGFSPFFTVCEQKYASGELTCASGDVKKIDAKMYMRAREALLADRTHVRLSAKAALYQERLCFSSGGGFFAAPGGVFAAERAGSTLHVKELLGCAARFAAAIPAERYVVRTPSDGGGTPFAMLRNPPLCGEKEPWLGFAFD